MKKVIIYSTPTCEYCKKAKNFLKDLAEVEEIDVSKDPQLATFLRDKTGKMGVPVIKIDDTYIFGFDKIAMIDALGN